MSGGPRERGVLERVIAVTARVVDPDGDIAHAFAILIDHGAGF